MIDAFERGDYFRAILREVDGTAIAFQGADRFIPVDRHEKSVAEGPRLLEVAHVSGVKQIEAAVRENKLAPLFAAFLSRSRQLLGGENFFLHGSGAMKS